MRGNNLFYCGASRAPRSNSVSLRETRPPSSEKRGGYSILPDEVRALPARVHNASWLVPRQAPPEREPLLLHEYVPTATFAPLA
jgi:hypothetical protein